MPTPPNMSPSAVAASQGTTGVVNLPEITVSASGSSTDPQAAVYGDDSPTGLSDLRFPLDTPMYYTRIEVCQFARRTWASVGTLTAENTIVLPVPEQVIDALSQQFATVPIGLVGAAGMGLFGSSSVKNAAAGAVNGIAEALAAGGVRLGKAGLDILTNGKLSPAVDGFLASQGLTLNDFLTVLYKGPDYKQFRFSWNLTPRTVQESQVIKQIEYVLKNAQAPSWNGGAGAFFAWPRVFRISFGRPGVDMGDRLFRFKPAVARAMAFNYAPGGVPSFYGGGSDTNGNWQASGYPESVRLEAVFEEVELWVNDAGKQNAYTGASNAPNGTINQSVIDTINQIGSALGQ